MNHLVERAFSRLELQKKRRANNHYAVRKFIYWCRKVKGWSHFSNKQLYREQLQYWLDIKPYKDFTY